MAVHVPVPLKQPFRMSSLPFKKILLSQGLPFIAFRRRPRFGCFWMVFVASLASCCGVLCWNSTCSALARGGDFMVV